MTKVEVKQVDIPEQMQRAIARQAEAERERRAKIIHAEGEFEASTKLAEAAGVLETQPAAIQLRYLQTLTEIGAEKNTTIVFPLPIDIINAWVKSTHDRDASGDREEKGRRRYGAGRPPAGGNFCVAGGDAWRGVHAGLSAGTQPVRYADSALPPSAVPAKAVGGDR